MVKTTYTCDMCKTEADNANQFWTVGVFAKCDYGRYVQPEEFVYAVENRQMQVCRACLESLGIHVKEKRVDASTPPVTTEDLIRQILERCQP